MAWQVLLEKNGVINNVLASIGLPALEIINTPAAVVLGMVYDYLPFMILPIYNALIKIDKNVIEAAYDLGANYRQVLSKVIIPLSIPGIVSGVTMVFVPSISTFYISQKLGGGTFELIGDTIERQFVTGAYNVGAAISLVMMILILISLGLMNYFSEEGEGGIIP
jgi:spermidine/putrescine transport system permease protein